MFNVYYSGFAFIFIARNLFAFFWGCSSGFVIADGVGRQINCPQSWYHTVRPWSHPLLGEIDDDERFCPWHNALRRDIVFIALLMPSWLTMLIPVSRAIRKAIKALYLFLNIQTHTSSTSAVKTAVLYRGESSQSQLFLRYFARILLDYPNLT